MLKARKPLQQVWDAIHALEAGERPLESHWNTAISCLRAVGHVLTVDAKKSPKAKLVIDKHWEQWKEGDTWFTDFIEHTRNELLKEWEGLPDITISCYGDYDEIINVSITLPDGTDGLHCLNEAAQWLSDELDEIEQEIND